MTPDAFWAAEMQNRRLQQEQERYNQEMIMQGITQFAGAYAENKAMDAKGAAYGDFMKNHGEQLGFKPEYLQDFLKKKPREQAMIGDQIIGMQNTGSKLMSLNYMKQQADSFGRRGDGTGAGGGGERILHGAITWTRHSTTGSRRRRRTAAPGWRLGRRSTRRLTTCSCGSM
jgi:hypothetical protein